MQNRNARAIHDLSLCSRNAERMTQEEYERMGSSSTPSFQCFVCDEFSKSFQCDVVTFVQSVKQIFIFGTLCSSCRCDSHLKNLFSVSQPDAWAYDHIDF